MTDPEAKGQQQRRVSTLFHLSRSQIKWPSIPSDALPDEGQHSYHARRYMEIHAKNNNARVQSETMKSPVG